MRIREGAGITAGRFGVGRLLHIFFPPACLVCGKETEQPGICDDCKGRLTYIRPPFCTKCGRPFASDSGISHICHDCIKGRNRFVAARAVFEYSGDIVRLIQRFKFGDRVDLSSYLSDELLGLYDAHLSSKGIAAIIPVPLSVRRLKHRSYNQTRLLAAGLSGKLSVPMYQDVLEKIKETPPQSRLSAKERHENVKHAYRAADRHALRGRPVLLVDDVITTGATVNACVSALRKAGIRRVYVLALALRV
ncbi:MAG: ComF family protein [Deltaproteobacteria bacterium]|nr:ComF family protein [Deltaproteobacteria bacterium]MCL5276457.1 ComF family protein [Deltaproteobacteria bacterium]